MNTMIDGIDYGPLAALVGQWVGNKGVDIAPDNQANVDESKFTDELNFSVAGHVENAEEQLLVCVKYHHVIRRSKNGVIFHDQIGHWIYDSNTKAVVHSFSIPRAVCVLAGGTFQDVNGSSVFKVEAKAGSETFGILQSPFMLKKAKTKKFNMELIVKGNELKYRQVMWLYIYGKNFEHSDKSTLQRVAYI